MSQENRPAPRTRAEVTAVVEQIQHGPYEAAPLEMIFHYLTTRHHRPISVHPATTSEKLATDIESEWQYTQHAEAVHEAMEAGRISSDQAIFMEDVVLRPWFIGVSLPE